MMLERVVVTGYSATALDVGGVIYYDEPFELAWLQGTFERLCATDQGMTLGTFAEQVERHYSGDEILARSEEAAESWIRVRGAWGELAQEIPGAVRAVARLSREMRTVIVANQPPECAGVLSAWGVSAACEAVFLDSLVGVAKPDPALLGMALDHLGVPPADLLMVGNRVDHDVLPALGLGCAVAFVMEDSGYRRPFGVHPDLERAYRAIRSSRPVPTEGERITITASLAELSTGSY